MRRALLTCAIVLSALSGSARAELLTFTQKFVADFEFSLVGGTPINPGPTTPFIPFQAIGSLTFTLDPSLNDPGQPTTVPFTNFTGSLDGVSPPPFLPFSIDPNVQFVGGDLTNIVRDGGGNVISADVTNLAAFWEMFGPGGIRLFGDATLPFSGHIGSIPFGYGTVIAGAANFNVYLDTGGGVGPLVAIGRNRTLTAVPEPSTLALAGVGGLAGLGLWRRRARA